ncbi:MAG: two-component sensor histidine kinase [Planctomycetota bacterium]|nr:MAG: two-component sensor histidine kinase [Planctomycetota bacterium]
MTEQSHQPETDIARVIGGLIHEIKNPLSTLSMNLQLLAEDFEGTDGPKERRARQRIGTLLSETKRLEILLNDFLKYLKGAKPLLEEVDINALLEETIEFICPEAEKQNIEVKSYLAEGTAVVKADANLLRQAILNLTLNACEAMPEGGELVLRTDAYDDAVKVRVIDNGRGIPEEVMPRIFDPFFSTKPNGTGLGLPTARRVMEALGGRIDVESEPEQGTQVRLTFPVE